MEQRKWLVYEAYLPPYKSPVWKAVEASGLRGLMVGVAPESRIYSWWAKDGQTAIEQVESWLKQSSKKGE